MNILTPGYLYELPNFNHSERPVQTLQFIEYEVVDGAFRMVHDGTTNEDLIRVLIDRLNFLNAKAPCRENSIAITHVETALLWLEKRSMERKSRGVEGTPKP